MADSFVLRKAEVLAMTAVQAYYWLLDVRLWRCYPVEAGNDD
ncbi:MAG: hypothetical protein Q7T26_10300 [Dehalococcoidia bacterium]|nr:hypothetical protein [Dehalococcoidia bacterium]